MSRIYIIADRNEARCILSWLSKNSAIGGDEVAAIILPGVVPGEGADCADVAGTDLCGVGLVDFGDVIGTLRGDDIIIVADPDVGGTVAELFSRGLYNLFDGESIMRRVSPAARFLDAAADLYLGPNTPATSDTERDEFVRYSSRPVAPEDIPRHKLFVVNSMPKAGSVWMIAMLEELLGVRAKQRITVSHVRDIETDWPKRNSHGALVLVRDMRDVVVSWFHHLVRSDLQNGFSAPRYPDFDEFYFDYFIGQIFGSQRYYSGNLEEWLNYAGARSFPILRYEDLLNDTPAALCKVMNFWKIDIAEPTLRQVARDYAFDRMRETVSGRDGYVAEALESGHMRAGRVSSWQDELPMHIADDVNRRFADYQRRLNYL